MSNVINLHLPKRENVLIWKCKCDSTRMRILWENNPNIGSVQCVHCGRIFTELKVEYQEDLD